MKIGMFHGELACGLVNWDSSLQMVVTSINVMLVQQGGRFGTVEN